MYLRIKIPLKICLFLLAGIILSACGGSDSDASGDEDTSTLSGTAATGLALSNKTVTVVDSTGGEVITTTAADGSYSVTVTTSTKPYMLKVETNGEPLFSFAAQSGVANITPLTNLAMLEANKNGTSYEPLANLFNSFKDHYTEITETALQQAKGKVNANIASVLSGEGLDNAIDFFSTSFSANGTGIDAVLDAVDIEIGSGGAASNITITINGSSAFSFNPDIAFEDFLPGGNSNGGNGSGTTEGCSSRTTAYADTAAFFADVAGEYVINSITGGNGSVQTAIESKNYVELQIQQSGSVYVRTCDDPQDSASCGYDMGYAASLQTTGTAYDLLDHETNIYFGEEASRKINLFYDHSSCELILEYRPQSPNSPLNWAALHYDPAATATSGGSGSATLSGTWDLTITGTVGGIAIPVTTLNDFPAQAVPTASSAGQSEEAFNQSFGAVGNVSNFNYSLVSSSATQVVVNVSATVTMEAQVVQGVSIPAQTFNYDLTYTYNKQ